MIRVVKPANEPAHLALANAITTSICAAFEDEALSFIEGFLSFDFDKSIYGHQAVKQTLIDAQHSKCCYCEAKFRANSPGDVEHFRPKKSVFQSKGAVAEHPGYYWLAYSWSNLYFSCDICNRSNKKSFFPLDNPLSRARIHTESIADERPLLLDPGGPDDPRAHIHFHNDVPFGITPQGIKTVEVLNLQREDLNEKRREKIAHLKLCKELVDRHRNNPLPGYADLADAARQTLQSAVNSDAEFCAMAQDFLR